MACADIGSPTGYGLKLVDLEMASDALSKLRLGADAGTPVSCRVRLDDESGRVCRIATAGAATRDDQKKSYDLELPEQYQGKHRYRLSPMKGDTCGIRALLASYVFQRVGLSVPEIEPVAVWLNREYLGLYTLLEPIDEDFFTRRSDSVKALYKARTQYATLQSTSNVEAAFASKTGETGHGDLRELIRLVNEQGPDSAAALEELVNTDAVLRYMAASAFMNNWDGVRKNYFLARTLREPRFVICPWDVDNTFEREIATNDGLLFESNALMHRLYTDSGERYQEALDPLLADENTARVSAKAEELALSIADARLRDPWLSQWPFEAEVEGIKSYIARHTRPPLAAKPD